MKTARYFIGLTTLALVLSVSVACKKKSDAGSASGSDAKSQMDKVSYILGYSTGKSFLDQDVADVNVSEFERGFKDGLTKDKKPALTEEQMREEMQAFRTVHMERMKKKMEEAGKKNEDAGKKFLEENKAKTGVVTLPSGLQYKVITAGTGPKPAKTDTVNVEYTGKLINGTEFDSTKEHGKPATFPVGQVIPGFSEALQAMPVGSTWEVYIPANLAYGANGMGKAIGPNETLIFNVHLVSIDKPAAAAPEAPKPAAPVKKK